MAAVAAKVQQPSPARTPTRKLVPSTAPGRRAGAASIQTRRAERIFPTAGRFSPMLPVLQSSSRASAPGDAAEREADATARRVVSMPAPATAMITAAAGAIQRKALGAPPVAPAVTSQIHAAAGGGTQLPPRVRRFMEPRFGADFGGVRVHHDERAARLSNHLSAQAFTAGSHIFFGRGQFQPDNEPGRELIAHELTHTIQQGAAIQRKADVRVAQSTPPQIQRLGFGDILDWLADKANVIPGFRMFTIVLGVNPINMSGVDRSAANILRALIEFLPGGGLITQALDNSGVFEKVGNWVAQQIAALGMVGSAIKAAVTEFIDSLHLTDLLHPGAVWDRAKRIFTAPIDRIINFAKGLVSGIIDFIKEAILRPLGKLAEGTRAYDLLKALLGKDPVTGDPAPSDAQAIIAGLMKLAGQEEIWANIKKANAIGRIAAWFTSAKAALVGFVEQIPDLALAAFRSLELVDIVLVPRAFMKVGAVFGGFVGKFISWVGDAIWKMLEIVFDVVSPGAFGYVKKTGAALKSILRNPLPFVGNLGKAAKLGFQNFGGNFLNHLKAGLINWLTGSLPGIYIPRSFSLVEIVKFALSVLGLSWANVRQKLVKVVGETAVAAMEKGFAIVKTLVTQGPAAAWEQIKGELSNLKGMVIDGIIDMVVDAITKKAVPKLIAMFIPGAGFVSAILSIYDMVMVFVQKIRTIIQVVTAFVDSIVAIAGGAIGAAAGKVESILANLLSLAISFLAGFAGLGKVADKVMGIIQKVRAPIDKALDGLIGWIVAQARRLFARVFGKDKNDDRTDEQKLAAVNAAVAEAEGLLAASGATQASVAAKLPALKVKYKLLSVVLEQPNPGDFDVLVEINPKKATKKKHFDPALLKPNDVVTALAPTRAGSSTLGWCPGIVTAVDATKKEFRWQSSNLSVQRTALLRFDDQGSKWKKGNEAQVTLGDAKMEEENKKQSWGDIATARKVLNYRHHGAETNVPGKQWEHIIEQSAGGAHSSGNLALTGSTINNRLGTMFGRPYASHEAPPGLPGTDDQPLRAFLGSQSLFIKNRWKQHFYGQLGVALSWGGSERGIWRELS